jgi:hypothetical protein
MHTEAMEDCAASGLTSLKTEATGPSETFPLNYTGHDMSQYRLDVLVGVGDAVL